MPRASPLQRATDVLQEQDEVQLVRRALLEFVDDVQIEVARASALCVDQEATATDAVGEPDETAEAEDPPKTLKAYAKKR